jgi:hypothetical protein
MGIDAHLGRNFLPPGVVTGNNQHRLPRDRPMAWRFAKSRIATTVESSVATTAMGGWVGPPPFSARPTSCAVLPGTAILISAGGPSRYRPCAAVTASIGHAVHLSGRLRPVARASKASRS